MSDTTNENRRKDDARPARALTWTDPAPAAAHLRDVMIDIETMGTAPGSAIVSIGAVMFGPAGLGDEFYAPISLASCTAVGLTIDPATVTWWMKQSDAARAAVSRDDAEPLPVVLQRFTCWFELVDAEKPWCQGANFDAPLLEAAYRACGMTAPWKFWNVRDTRTLYEQADVKVDRARGTHHNALDDARAQAEAAVISLQRLQDMRAQAAPASPEQVPAIGRLLDEFSALPVLWGLNEPGALMRHSDVFKMLVNAGKTYLAAPIAAAPAAEEVQDKVREQQECWSANEEDFNALSLDQLLSENDHLKEGDTVWVGVAVRPKASRLIGIETILEQLSESAYDIAGESADDYPDVSKAHADELEVLLADWIKRACPPNFWTVENIRPYVLASADFSDDLTRAASTEGEARDE